MALSGQSLNAVTATGPGAALAFDEPKSSISMHVTSTGSPSTITVALEYSIDGINWFLARVVSATSGTTVNDGYGPALFARANLTALSGGTLPTVTAWLAAA